jgi:hypothetical protein
MGGGTAPAAARYFAGYRGVSVAAVRRARVAQAGLTFAREWRAKNKPIFDALYGPEICPRCGAVQHD